MDKLLKKVYKEAWVCEGSNQVILDGTPYPCKIGKHEIWIPDLPGKIIWMHNGQIEGYRDWDKGRNAEKIRNQEFCVGAGYDKESITSIISEYQLFEILANAKMSPPVHGIFHIKTVLSNSPFYGYADPKGVFGIYMEDASKLPFGKFSTWDFEDQFVGPGLIELSSGALGDVGKPNNEVNGYLIDVRRTAWDMMKLRDLDFGEDGFDLIPEEDVDELKKRISQLAQFPHKERSQNYQSYKINGEWVPGTRDTLYRFDQMQIEKDLTEKTVLDLGCQLGSMISEAVRRGAKFGCGIDGEKDYIECARDLARMNGQPINFRHFDLLTPYEAAKFIRVFYQQQPIDIIFALALYKHIKENLWLLLNMLDWKTCYIESHNAPEGEDTGHVLEMKEGMKELGAKITPLGMVEDRSPRYIWRLDR